MDIGGETADISVHRLSRNLADNYVETILPAQNNCGGSKVNKIFAEFLEELVDDKGFMQYVHTGNESSKRYHKAALNKLLNETFERSKRVFGAGEIKFWEETVGIPLPYSFLEVYQSELTEGIRKLNDSRVQLIDNELQIAYSKMEEFFQPVVESVLHYIAETLDGTIYTIYIVGGFGGCKYVYNAIAKEFGDSFKVVTPERNVAVVHGAVLLGQLLKRVENGKYL